MERLGPRCLKSGCPLISAMGSFQELHGWNQHGKPVKMICSMSFSEQNQPICHSSWGCCIWWGRGPLLCEKKWPLKALLLSLVESFHILAKKQLNLPYFDTISQLLMLFIRKIIFTAHSYFEMIIFQTQMASYGINQKQLRKVLTPKSTSLKTRMKQNKVSHAITQNRRWLLIPIKIPALFQVVFTLELEISILSIYYLIQILFALNIEKKIILKNLQRIQKSMKMTILPLCLYLLATANWFSFKK